jgi:ABC-2 type transport system ATP-binding protein
MTAKNEPFVVRVRGLQVNYGSVRAVDGVDLDVPRGQLLAFLGPNGAGKSTTVGCWLGLQRWQAGEVTVAGMAPYRAVRRGLVGAMLQVGGLPEGATVREVVTLASALHKARGRDVHELLQLAGLRDLARRKVTALSGGQAQRVRFAVAVAGNPRVLFLDEPTTGMDVETRELFWTTVRHLADTGITVIFATHYLTEADKYADRVVMIARGRIVADGTATHLKAHLSSDRIIELTTDDPAALQQLKLPSHPVLEVHGSTVRIRTHDTDRVLAALYRSGVSFSDITVAGGDLDDVLRSVSHEQEDI